MKSKKNKNKHINSPATPKLSFIGKIDYPLYI